MNRWFLAAIVLAALALLAYHWRYTYAGWNKTVRRNLQLLLFVSLLAGSAVCALEGLS